LQIRSHHCSDNCRAKRKKSGVHDSEYIASGGWEGKRIAAREQSTQARSIVGTVVLLSQCL
jgi:hypothetical protein